MQKRLPVRERGDTPLNALGLPERRTPTPDNYGVLDGNSPSGSRDSRSGGGGGDCGYSENCEGTAHVVFYRLPDSVLFSIDGYNQQPYLPFFRFYLP